MRDGTVTPDRTSLFAPLLLVAVVAAMLGFVVQRGLTTPGAPERVDVSVIALPSTPEPTPSPKPTSSPRSSVRIGGSSRGGTTGSDGGSSGGAVSNCPPGCQCEARPPGGVVIVCH